LEGINSALAAIYWENYTYSKIRYGWSKSKDGKYYIEGATLPVISNNYMGN
jgi:hypothetical protein